MLYETTIGSAHVHSTQELVEKISGLEEEVDNLRRLHQTIARNNSLFEALIASSYDGIALTRLDGTVIRLVRSILGHGTSELSGMSIFDLVHPDDRETMRELYRRIARNDGRQFEDSVRLLCPDGSAVWVQGTITDMLDNPAVQAIVHNYRNVSQLKAGEFAAAELAAVIRHAAFALFSKSVTGEILSWNDGAREIFGYQHEEIVGRHVWTMVPPELRDQEQHTRSIVVQEKTATGKIRTVRIRKDGTPIPIELILSPVMMAGRVEGIAHLSYPLTSK